MMAWIHSAVLTPAAHLSNEICDRCSSSAADLRVAGIFRLVLTLTPGFLVYTQRMLVLSKDVLLSASAYGTGLQMLWDGSSSRSAAGITGLYPTP